MKRLALVFLCLNLFASAATNDASQNQAQSEHQTRRDMPAEPTAAPSPNWPAFTPNPAWQQTISSALTYWTKEGYQYTPNFQNYTTAGDYFNFGTTEHIETSSVVKFDANGVPMVNYGGTYYYNPVTISEWALEQYGKYLHTNQASDLTLFYNAINQLLSMQDSQGAFRYPFPFLYYLTQTTYQPGWVSGMAQGMSLSVLSRAYLLTKDPKYLAAGDQAFTFMKIMERNGGTMVSMTGLDPSLGSYILFDEYPQTPSAYTLNGSTFALFGVYDWSQVPDANQTLASEYFNDALTTLKHNLPYYEVGGFTSYDMGHITYHAQQPDLNPPYHAIHIYLLHALNTIAPDPILQQYEQIFINDVAPVIVFPRSLTFTTQAVGTSSVPEAVVVNNNQTAQLHVTSVTPSSDFKIVSDGCSGQTIAVRGNCQFSVEFSPTDTANTSGTATIVDNGPGSPHTVTLTTAPGTNKAQLLSPAPGSVLTSNSQTFNWTQGVGVGVAVTGYVLYIGSQPNKYDIDYESPKMGTSASVTNIPLNGGTIYATLWTQVNGVWQPNSYTYSTVAPVPATMSSPAQGSTLAGSSQVFTWNSAVGSSGYVVWVGTTKGGHDLDDLSTTNSNISISNLPTNGEPVYVRLQTKINGTWQFNDYSYVASGVPPAPVKATMISPTNGSTLSGSSQLFNWTPGSGVIAYVLWVGTASNAHDLDLIETSQTSLNISNLPANNTTVYVSLWSYIGGTWQIDSTTKYHYTSAP